MGGGVEHIDLLAFRYTTLCNRDTHATGMYDCHSITKFPTRHIGPHKDIKYAKHMFHTLVQLISYSSAVGLGR